ncbi:MAG: hypothetical protein ABSF52_20700, partial [Syntrophobacteraceae bacterium]
GQRFGFGSLPFRILVWLMLEGNLHEAAFDFTGVWLIPGLKGGGRNEAARIGAQSRTSWRGPIHWVCFEDC